MGWQTQSQIPIWLKAADILVLPNSALEKIGAVYTSPLKLFEYMASGTPIVASAVPALAEVLGKSEAVFFEPDNANALAEVLKNSLANFPWLEVRASAALKKVQQFTWTKRAEFILEHVN